MTILNNYNTDSPIAFFDSGVGGLTVFNNVKKLLPNENYVYYGDTLHVPYGEKTKEQLLEYSDHILKFFESLGCKAVIMACNTTSSIIYDDINGKYNFKIYPIVQSAAKILSELKVLKLGVFATKGTVLSKTYEREIMKYNPNIKVYSQYCPQWVKIVENNMINSPNAVETVKNDLDKMMANKPEKIILGCTHYPFLLNILTMFQNSDLFIDPAIFFAEYIATDLRNDGLLNEGKNTNYEKFYVSSNPEKFKSSAKMFYEMNDLPELLTF